MCVVESLVMTISFFSVQVRLVGCSRANKGYVESCGSNGVWGGICVNEWGINDVDVVCHMLGYPSATAYFKGQLTFGQAPPGSRFVLDNLHCIQTESYVFDGQGNSEWNHNCSASEIADVKCKLL